MCTVAVALTSTSVLVTVLVKVSVAVVLPASTEAGTSSATSAVAVVVKRIFVKDCGGKSTELLLVGCDGLYADRVCKDRGSSARSHKVDYIEVLSFLSSLAGSRPGGCFNCVLLELQGMAWDGGLWEGCRVGGCLKRVVERALLEMLGNVLRREDEVAITPYSACERRESCKERMGAVSGMRWLVACQPEFVFPR